MIEAGKKERKDNAGRKGKKTSGREGGGENKIERWKERFNRRGKSAEEGNIRPVHALYACHVFYHLP